MTKPDALELLKNMPFSQRDLNWKKVHMYKEAMNRGFFKLEPKLEIVDGKVINGQHRLMAFYLSNLKKIDL